MDIVVCQVCGKSFRQITNKHLLYHGMTPREYKVKYPGKLVCDSVSEILAANYRLNPKAGFPVGHKVNEGKTPWNKDRTKRDDTRVEKYASKLRGRTVSEETRKRVSSAAKQGFVNGTRNVDGQRNGMYGKKLSAAHKTALLASTRGSLRMTKPEVNIKSLLDRYNDGWEYTGDRKLWLDFPDGRKKNPDFVHRNRKYAIEVFGNYWHKPEEIPILTERYASIGWKVLILWEKDVNKHFCVDAVEQFAGYDDPENYRMISFSEFVTNSWME